MPKVLRIINRFNLGGPTYNAAYLTKYLSPEFETLLIGGSKDESEESSEFILKKLELDYRILPEMRRSINPFSDLAAYKKLKAIIREWKPDIVHTHAAKAGALGRMAAAACKVPVIVHTFHGHVFHSYFGSLKTGLYKKVERHLAAKSSAIIAISEKQKEELSAIHHIAPAEKFHVIPLGFDLQRFNDDQETRRKAYRAAQGLAEHEVAIGIVGRLVPVKNHALFLEAVQYVSKNSQKKIRAIIIGDGEERQHLESLTDSMGLRSIVHFSSWEKQVENVYPGLDIVCLSSFNEGTPVSLIEAQAANRPLVSTNTGGIENVVIPGETALLSDVSDKETYCKNLLNLVENEALRQKMGFGGWEHVRNKYHYTRLVNDVASLYRSLIQ